MPPSLNPGFDEIVKAAATNMLPHIIDCDLHGKSSKHSASSCRVDLNEEPAWPVKFSARAWRVALDKSRPLSLEAFGCGGGCKA